MARPRQFNPEEALAKAMELFWERGFENTSIQDLVEHTGVNRYSLYENFGDKRELFFLALKLYADRFFILLLRDLKSREQGLAPIRRCLQGLEARLCHPHGNLGCLLLNSAHELGTRDELIIQEIHEHFEQLEDCFFEVLENARQEGLLDPALQLRDAARFLNSFCQGVTALRRANSEAEAIRGAIRMTLGVLDAWSQATVSS